MVWSHVELDFPDAWDFSRANSSLAAWNKKKNTAVNVVPFHVDHRVTASDNPGQKGVVVALLEAERRHDVEAPNIDMEFVGLEGYMYEAPPPAA